MDITHPAKGLLVFDSVANHLPLLKEEQEQQQMINDLKKQNEALNKINSRQCSLNEELLKLLEKLESLSGISR